MLSHLANKNKKTRKSSVAAKPFAMDSRYILAGVFVCYTADWIAVVDMGEERGDTKRRPEEAGQQWTGRGREADGGEEETASEGHRVEGQELSDDQGGKEKQG